MIYLCLNLIFLALVIGVLLVYKKYMFNTSMLITLVVLIIMTAIFDSLIVGFGIVDYDETKILGIRIAQAPIEDFFYAILAAIIVPIVWANGGRHDRKK